MTYKIGVYGSNRTEHEDAVRLARELGQVLAQQRVIVVTGACSGMPYCVAQSAKECGAEIWGFSPEYSEQEQQQAYPSDDRIIYDQLFFVPSHLDQTFSFEQTTSPVRRSTRLKYRNVVSTTYVHAGIILSGGWGTMNEFTNLLYDGKAVGVLTGTGGLADQLPQWYPQLRQKSESVVMFDRSPEALVATLMQQLLVTE